MGAEFGMTMHLGINYSMMNEIIEFDDGKRIAWQTRPAGKFQSSFFGGRIWRYELEPADGRHARPRELGHLAGEGADQEPAADRAQSKEHTRDAMEKTLANIARLTEEQ